MNLRRRFRSQAARIILAQLSKMISHEKGTLRGDDIECLHCMRIASRRLRARIQDFRVLFGGRSYRRIQKQVRAITRRLGTARDLDVFEAYLKSIPRNDSGLIEPVAALLLRVHAQQATSRREIGKFFGRVRRRGIVRKIRGYFQKHRHGPMNKSVLRAHMRSFSRQVIEPRWNTLKVYRSNRFTGSDGAAELHRMRILAKKLRYSMEIFKIYYGEDYARLILEVRKVQDDAGRVHDLEIYEQRIRKLVKSESLDAVSCIGLLDYCGRERAESFSEFQRTWRAFWQLDLGIQLRRYWLGTAAHIPG
jgi:CHAD domain-containing protein